MAGVLVFLVLIVRALYIPKMWLNAVDLSVWAWVHAGIQEKFGEQPLYSTLTHLLIVIEVTYDESEEIIRSFMDNFFDKERMVNYAKKGVEKVRQIDMEMLRTF